MTDALLWPVTPLQAGLVALAELREPGLADPYVGQTLLRIDGPLDADALTRAIETLTDAHRNLRAGLVMGLDLDPLQFVDDDVPVDVQVRDLAVGQDPRGLAAQALAEPFDLGDPPLVRWLLLRSPRPVEQPSWLVVTAHHAVLDGWSMPLLVDALAEHYAAALGHSTPPAAQADYSTFLAWSAAQPTEPAAAYWAERFAAVELTGTAPWLAQATAAPAPRSHQSRLDAQTVAALTARAVQLGVTAAGLARTAWGVALDRVAGTAPGRGEAVFATAVAGRPAQVVGADTMIGLFADSVLTHVPVDPGARLGEVARAHHDDWSTSLAHQHLGLRGTYRALGQEELATSLLAFEAPRDERARPLGPATTLTIVGTLDRSHYPLAVTVAADTEWSIEVEYDAGRVSDDTATAVAAAFTGLLRAVATDPERRIAEVTTLDPAQLATLTAISPGAADHAVDHATDHSVEPPLLPQEWTRVVAQHPERTALVVGPRSWTFAELGAEVTAARNRLAQVGGPGQHTLALCLPRDERLVAGILAGLTAGAAILAVDPVAPAERRAQLLAAAGATVLWDLDGPRTVGAVPSVVPPPDLRHQVASIVFTSGSTGAPKPVAVAHHALAHLLRRQDRELYPAADGTRRVAHTAAFHFDAHWDAFLALLCGHELHLLDEDTFLDAHVLGDYVTRHDIDYLDFTPTVWSALLAGGLAERGPLPRTCVVGGEAFPPALWTRMRDLAATSDSRVLNLYGPTEACVDTLGAEVTDHDAPVVGRAIGASTALVLDDMLRPVPPGTWGELYLAGPQLALGYLGQPGRTAERFVARPKGAPGERMYRTGDLALVDPGAGVLRLGGRTDEQISLHGHRIEPGEVERVLLDLDAVAEAVVVALTHPRLGKRLVGYVVAAPGPGTDLAERAVQHCADALPRHLVPSRVVVLDRLPLTRNGKLDRRALPLPSWDGAPTGPPAPDPLIADQVDPGALVAVRRSLARALGNDQAEAVSAEDDFFALGGDSIAAIRVVGLLRREGWQIRGQQVLSLRTPLAIAHAVQPVSDLGTAAGAVGPVLDSAQHAALTAHVAEHGLGALDAVLALTPAQQGILLDAQLAIAAGAADPYRTTATLRLDADRPLQAADVQAALDAWLVRYPNLAVGIWQHDLPEPVAYVPQHRRVPLDVVRLATEHPGPAAASATLARVAAAELDRASDFAAARLVGATWVPTGSRTSYLVVSMHHLLADGWSLPILADDLADLLAADTDERAALSTEVQPGFAEHLRWIASLRAERGAVERLWRTELAGFTPRRLTAAPGAAVAAPVVVTGSVAPETSARWQLALATRGVTWAEAAQAAWAIAWGAATGAEDVCFGLTAAGRAEDVAGSAAMVGLFITTRPVRLTLDRRGGPAGPLLAAVRSFADRTERAQHLGLAVAQRAAGAPPGGLFDSLVVIENYPRPQPRPDRPITVVPLSGQDGTGYPVTLTVYAGDQPRWEVEGRHPALTTAVLTALAQTFEQALGTLLDHDQVPSPHQLAAPSLPMARPEPHATSTAETTTATTTEGRATAQTAQTTETAAAAARVLGLDTPLAPDADFFTQGGDSITAIALVGALRGAGLVVGIRAIFEGRTPAGIAARATRSHGGDHPDIGDRSGRVDESGELPLTPALAWFVSHTDPGQRHGFQQVRVLAVPPDIRDQTWASALAALVARHPALRLALRGDQAEVIAQPPGDVLAGHGVEPVALARQLAALIDPAQGVVLRAGLVRQPGGTQLVLVAHHLAVDAVSWRILTDDLRALLAGQVLPRPGSIRAWALAQHTAAPHLAERVERWAAALPADGLELGRTPLGQVGSATQVVVELSVQETARFQEHTAAGVAPDHLLVAAVAAAAGRPLVIEAEGHGRDLDLPGGLDPADTVGWLTATWPVPVTPAATCSGTFAATAAALEVTDGPEYGVLRHLLPAGRKRLGAAEAAHPPQVLVNYLGRDALGGGLWQASLDSAAVETELGLHDQLPASHPLELNATLTGDRLIARWQIAAGAAPAARELVERWTDQLRLLLACSPSELTAARSPYDAAGLGPAAISVLLTAHPQISDVDAIWPLTPVQRGLWFHAVSEDVDGYTSAVALDLHGPLNAARLHRALDTVVARHPQLRIGVLTQPDGGPIAVSRRDLRAPWRESNEPALDPARRAELLTAHEREPFDLTGPLLRAHLVRIAADHHHLVLANHHLLLDGWSVPLLVRELLATYADDGASPAGPPDPRHTDLARLTAWQQAHPADTDRWREHLAGAAPTLLGGPQAEPADAAVVRSLDEGWHSIEDAARAATVTLPTLVLTAWSLVLGALAGSADVVTGTVVAGRPGDLPGAEELLGMFVTTLPVRSRWDATTTCAALLDQAGDDAIGRLDTGPVALGDLHRLAGVPTLFDSLVVVENYPHDPAAQPAATAGVTIGAIEGMDATHYPLSLTVEPGEGLRLEYSSVLLSERAAAAMLDAVVEAATALVTQPDRAVAEIVAELRTRLAPLPGPTPAPGPGAVDPERLTAVRSAFATALNLPAVSADDDFFALGGDSILAMRVVAQLRTDGLLVRPKALFAAPTPTALAALVTRAEPEPAAEPAAPAAPGSLLDFDPTSDLEDLLRNP